jgi:tRNA U34 5-carboxymethylaminomethyl modifying GTPase MnmE/TrmE
LERIADLLVEARELSAAGDPVASVESPELVAAVLREVLDELGAITGDVSPDDVLGLIFSSFCVGK